MMRRNRWLGLTLCVGLGALGRVALSAPGPAGGQATQTQVGTASTGASAGAQAPTIVDPRFDSPRSTMFTFLGAMDRNDLTLAAKTMDVPPAERDSARELSAQLLEVLNRAGLVYPEELPDRARVERDGVRSFVYFPRDIPRHREMASRAPGARIVLTPTANGEWKFSPTTVATISTLWRKTDDFKDQVNSGRRTVAMKLRGIMPASLRRSQILGVENWQWIGLALIAFLAIVLDFMVRFVVRSVAVRWARRRDSQADRETLDRLVRPLGLLAGSALALSTLWMLGLPPTALAALMVAVRLVLMVSGVWSAFRATDLIGQVLADKAAQTSTRFDDLLVPLARKTAKVIIFALGLIYIANSLQIEILPLLTGLGIGGLAVAFAAKDTIENFFGSVAVIVDRPFEVGDWIVVDGVEGTVEELGFRSTRVRTFYNSQVTVPNSLLVRATVDNYGRRKYRRFKTTIGVAYHTPPDVIEAFCAGVREIILQHPYTRKDYFHVWLNNMGASSLDILVYLFFETPDWATELRERQRFILDALRLANKLQVEIAFETRTVYLRKDEEPASLQRPLSAESRAVRFGAGAARSVLKEAEWRDQTPGAVLFEGKAIDIDAETDDDSQVESRAGGEE